MEPATGVVLFGDVSARATARTRDDRLAEPLCRTLDRHYAARAAGILRVHPGRRDPGAAGHRDADPFEAVLVSTLARTRGSRRACRGCAGWRSLGAIDPGRGPATHRTGEAFLRARALLEPARADRDGLLCRTGDPDADAYLAGTSPVLAAIIERMTDRQRQVARLALVDGLRQSEIAERLDVARPTVSVMLRAPTCATWAAWRCAIRADLVARASTRVRRRHGMSTATLVLSWLVLCHLLADFVLQPRAGRSRQVRPRDRTPGGRCSSTPAS